MSGSSVTFKSESPFKRPQSTPKPAPTPSSVAAETPAPTVIPSSWLAPYEQRRLFFSMFGLIEVSTPPYLSVSNTETMWQLQAIKVWDIVAPYFIPNIEPTWSSSLRVRSWWTAIGWTTFEVLTFAGVSSLRIPLLSPSLKQLMQLWGLLVIWNAVCWFVAEVSAAPCELSGKLIPQPSSFFMSVHLIGTLALFLSCGKLTSIRSRCIRRRVVLELVVRHEEMVGAATSRRTTHD